MRILLKQNETSFNQLFEDFLTSCKVRGLANTTIDSYRSHMHCIEKYLEVPNTISELEKRDIDNMIVAMRENDHGANTIKSYLRVFSVFVNWCRENGLTSLKIPPYKGEEVIKETYTDEELKVLLIKPNMKKCSFEEYRNWVIINLLLDCGCRAATIRAIENRDVDLHKLCHF